MTISLSHLTDLQRVRISISDLPDITVGVERSTNELFWQTVRGGVALPVIGGVAQLDDYEFAPDVTNHYRLVFPPEFVPIEELDMQQRIATEVQVVDSVGFTAETVVMTVVALLETGRTYRVLASAAFNSTVSDDIITARLRETDVLGNTLQERRVQIPAANDFSGYSPPLEAEFTATTTGSKTFVVTGARSTGTGTCRMEAASNRPAFLYVDYIRG